MTTPTDTKRCGDCKEEKPLAEFHNRRASKDGKQGYCKPCQRTRTSAWELKNPQSNAERSRKWRDANQDRVRENSRNYRTAHRERYIANAKAWNAAHPDRVKEIRRRYLQRKKARLAEEKTGAQK